MFSDITKYIVISLNEFVISLNNLEISLNHLVISLIHLVIYINNLFAHNYMYNTNTRMKFFLIIIMAVIR